MHPEGEETSYSSWMEEEGDATEVDFTVTPPNLDLYSELIPCSSTPLPAEPSSSSGDGGDDEEEESQHTVPTKMRAKDSFSRDPSYPSASNTKRTGNMGTPSPSKASIDEKEARNDKKRERKEDEEETNHKNTTKVWSEEDEKNLLALFLKYLQMEVGAPNDANAFFNFARWKLEKFQKRQIGDKLKRLRNKYEMNAKKERRGRLKAFSNHHDQDIFAICKCIWGTKAEAQGVMVREIIKAKETDINGKMNECNLKEDQVKGKEEMGTLTKESRRKQVENAQIELGSLPMSSDEREPVRAASEGRYQVPSPLKKERKTAERNMSDSVCSDHGDDVVIMNKPEGVECRYSVPRQKASTPGLRSALSALKTKENRNTPSGSSQLSMGGAKNERKRERKEEEDRESRKKTDRIWLEEDEKNLLGLFREYLQMGAADENDMNGFFNFASRKLEKFQKQQVKDKLRKLRAKYLTKTKMEKSGRSKVFSTEHDKTIFRICKAIWGKKAIELNVKFKESVKVAEKAIHREMNEHNCKEDALQRKEKTVILRKECYSKQDENEESKIDKSQSCSHDKRRLQAESQDNDGRQSIEEIKRTKRNTRKLASSMPEDGEDAAILNKPRDSTRGGASWSLLAKAFATFSGLQEATEREIQLLIKSNVEQSEEDRKKLEEMRLNIECESLQIAAERARLAREVMRSTRGFWETHAL